ncbi:glycerophosphocholine cholinephosphodiesterase ENPP6 [Cynoglossus semilaevis]|nr:ectonucleotide pyrophosphatase/phosphodiesterase family member 6 [Cynoglossus semilaevis]
MCPTLPPLLPLLLLLLSAGPGCLSERPLLVLLIDGFRYDYTQNLTRLPAFQELLSAGVKVDYTTPDFPSLSYPNYYTLMTGRHCDVHQMTGNYMWDQSSNKEFLIGTNQDSRLPLWWDGSEPLWVTMMKLKKKVFMYYWPGCEVEILGVQPSFCQVYHSSPSQQNFTDSMVSAVSVLSSGQADMAAIYYEDVDVMGHRFGPESAEVRRAVEQVDQVLQILLSQIKENHMEERLNIVLFSDHGMTNVQLMEKVIELDKFVNMSDVLKMMDRGAVVSVWPQDGKHRELFEALTLIPNMTVYDRQQIPERFHYKGGRFVSPLTLVADPGWFIVKNKQSLPSWQNGSAGRYNGWHGYDNQFPDMRGFFMASGPDFKRNHQGTAIGTVDVYNLLCWTLGIEPLPNNGSWSQVKNLLRDSDPSQPAALWTCSVCLLGIIIIGLWE